MLLLERAHKVLPERDKQEQSSSADMASLGTTETSLGSVPLHSDTVTGTSDGFSDNAEFIMDTMRRLAPHAPSAGSDKTLELLSVFLSKDHPVVESEARADIIAELDSDARALYDRAIKRGTVQLVAITEEILVGIITNPGAHKNLCLPKKGVPKGGCAVHELTPDNHSKYRFAAYDVLRKRLDYVGTGRVPLPLVCESIIKLCLPDRQENYTLFVGGGKRAREDDT